MPKTCKVPSCLRTDIQGWGMCQKHYYRWYRHGNPKTTQRVARHKNPTCSMDGCDNPTHARTLCMNHYALWRRNGAPVRTKVFRGIMFDHGYRRIWVAKHTYRSEQRLVVEQELGRPLRPDEHVHHKDGDKLNNAYENLQIVTPRQHAKLHYEQAIKAGKTPALRCRTALKQ